MKKVTMITAVGLKNVNQKPYVRAIGGETFYTGKMDVKNGNFVLFEETEVTEQPVMRDSEGKVMKNEDGTVKRNTEAAAVANVQRRIISVFETEELAIAALNFGANFAAKAEMAQLKHKAALQSELKELYAEYGVTNKADLLAQLI